ncbi:MAG: ankyrin repeat domain-containing protein [Candidatus Hydrogenedentes bacterium]|nr:ankyrin repeat domain-containing protein [Candidatus Hydrogenedentota bacterium]
MVLRIGCVLTMLIAGAMIAGCTEKSAPNVPEEPLTFDSKEAEFFHAVSTGDAGKVETMLAADPALVNVNNNVQRMLKPLHVAVMKDRWPVFDVLVKHGASVDVLDASGFSPLDYLLQKAANLPGRALVAKNIAPSLGDYNNPYFATLVDDADRLKPYLDADGDPDAVSQIARLPLLHLAIRAKSHAAAKMLLEAGASVSREIEGKQPLHFAALENDVEMVALLLEHGADSSAPDKDFMTPIALAADNRNYDVLEYFMEHDDRNWNSTVAASVKEFAESEGDQKMLNLVEAHWPSEPDSGA